MTARLYDGEVAGLFVERARAACEAGDFARAEALGRLALGVGEDGPAVLHLLAMAVLAQDRPAEAGELLRRAIAADPFSPHLYRELGRALSRLGQEAAVAALETARRLAPHDLTTLVLLAEEARRWNRLELAVDSLAAAVALAPDRADLAFELARLWYRLGRFEESAAEFRRAVGLAPQAAEPRTGLGVVLKRLNDLAGAVECHEAALALEPNHVRAHFNLANALLAAGDLRRGFAEFEWRLRLPGMRVVQTDAPRWAGEPLAGRTILLTAEQGFGDMIQFSRFIPPLVRSGARVIVECHPGLERLLAHLSGVAACVTVGDPLPAADHALPLLSLPHLLGVTADDLPRDPYLPVPAGIVAPRLETGGVRVGLVWSGNRDAEELRDRGCPLAALEPVLGVAGCSFHSLQVGEAAAEGAEHVAAGRLVDLSPHLHDFACTAALIDQLDLVITVDTAVAHLAGALGREVWVMLSAAHNDFRWVRWRGQCLWYPTARTYRQRKAGDWDGVAARIADDLRRLVRRAGDRQSSVRGAPVIGLTTVFRGDSDDPASSHP